MSSLSTVFQIIDNTENTFQMPTAKPTTANNKAGNSNEHLMLDNRVNKHLKLTQNFHFSAQNFRNTLPS